MTLPNLSPERLEQMIHLACSCKQDACTLKPSWVERALSRLHDHSNRLAYGLSATAVSLSCIGAFWLIPNMNNSTDASPSDFSVSEYMIQDLMDDLTQPTLNPDLSFQV